MSRATVKSQSSSKGKRRAQRQKRAPIPDVTWLSEGAPIGSYFVDRVAEELFAAGARGGSAIEMVGILRQKISFAASISTVTANNHFINGPRRLLKTRRLFRDIRKIKKFIERNSNLDRTDVVLSTKLLPSKKRYLKDQPDEIDKLTTAMHSASEAINELLISRKPQGNPGNYDPFTRGFIYEVSEFWQETFLWVEGWPDESRLFIRLLVAAWRDFKLPTKDVRGQRLEDWLTDRVRKQFSKGIYGVRESYHEQVSYRLGVSSD